jgi:hypothetical protein
MFLRLDSGNIKRGAVNIGPDTGFIIERKTVDGWDQVQIPNAVAIRWAKFILSHSKQSKSRKK